MKKILCCLFAISLLAGCSGKEEETKCTTCSMKNEPVSIVNEIEYTGDKAKIMKFNNEMNYVEYGLTKDYIEDQVETTKELYGGIKGVSYKPEIDDKSLKEIIIVDLEKADLQKLYEVGILETDGSTYVSAKRTIENWKEIGMECE